MAKDDTDKIASQLRTKRHGNSIIPASDFLGSGSTMLNLACSGHPQRCYAKGHYYRLVGRSDTGKTILGLAALAEASISKRFEDYRLIFDPPESGALMALEKFFGKKLADKIETPKGGFSSTTDEFYFNLDDAFKKGSPFIWCLDSMDALQGNAEGKKFAKRKRAARGDTNEQVAGDFGDGKAKDNSRNLRRVVARLKQTGSILLIISQAHDNIGFGAKFQPEVAAGGRAMKLYATFEIWMGQLGQIKSTVMGKPREQGIKCIAKVRKNRVSGWKRNVEFPILHSFGIDDTGSCVDFLIEEGHWPKKGNKIIADEFKLSLSREKLIRKIEADDGEKELRITVAELWNEIEQASKVKRKSRYG